jgi:hypothetical protein
MNRNNRSWRDEEREATLDYPIGVDREDPAYRQNPDAYEREIERLNRHEGWERNRGGYYSRNYR